MYVCWPHILLLLNSHVILSVNGKHAIKYIDRVIITVAISIRRANRLCCVVRSRLAQRPVMVAFWILETLVVDM